MSVSLKYIKFRFPYQESIKDKKGIETSKKFLKFTFINNFLALDFNAVLQFLESRPIQFTSEQGPW